MRSLIYANAMPVHFRDSVWGFYEGIAARCCKGNEGLRQGDSCKRGSSTDYEGRHAGRYAVWSANIIAWKTDNANKAGNLGR